MGSAAYFGKLANFQAASRKSALIPFGTFNAQDNLGFIASIPSPAQFTTADGSITGTLNGINAVFQLSRVVSTVVVTRNGVTMTQGVDYNFTNGKVITFLPGQIPQSTDIITAEGTA